MKISKLRSHIITVIATALLAAGALSSCSSTRKASKDRLPAETPADISLQTPQQRYNAVCGSYRAWEDVQMPVRLSLTSPKSLSANARAAMKRGEWISISVRMLGFEVASAFVDRDSVHIVDRYHKAYLSESLGRFLSQAGVTLEAIQDILLGRGFLFGGAGGTFTPQLATAFDFTPSPDGLMIIPAAQPQGMEYGFLLAPDSNNLAITTVSVGDNHAAVARYNDPVETSQAGNFAASTTLSLMKGKNISATLDWNFSQAKWNTGVQRSWKQPQGYRRLEAASLINKLTKL